jgi:hypothetical protein
LPRDRLVLYDCLCCKPLLLWRCQLFIHMPACSRDPLLLCPVASLSFTHDEGWAALRNQPLQCHVGAHTTTAMPAFRLCVLSIRTCSRGHMESCVHV